MCGRRPRRLWSRAPSDVVTAAHHDPRVGRSARAGVESRRRQRRAVRHGGSWWSNGSPGACQLTTGRGRGSSCWPAAVPSTTPTRAATATARDPCGDRRRPRLQRARPEPSGPAWRHGQARSGPRRDRAGSTSGWRAGGSARRVRRTGAASRVRSRLVGRAGRRWADGPPRRRGRAGPRQRRLRRPHGAAPDCPRRVETVVARQAPGARRPATVPWCGGREGSSAALPARCGYLPAFSLAMRLATHCPWLRNPKPSQPPSLQASLVSGAASTIAAPTEYTRSRVS